MRCFVPRMGAMAAKASSFQHDPECRTPLSTHLMPTKVSWLDFRPWLACANPCTTSACQKLAAASLLHVWQQTLHRLSESKRHLNAYGEGRHHRAYELFFPAHSTAADSVTGIGGTWPVAGHATAFDEFLRRQLSRVLCVTLCTSLVRSVEHEVVCGIFPDNISTARAPVDCDVIVPFW